MPLLEAGKLDLALVAGEIASAALAKPDTPLRIVAAMYSSPGMFIVHGDSPHRSIADLRGKPVVHGHAGFRRHRARPHRAADALGIEVKPIFLEKAADGPPMLMDGRADALWGAGVGWPAFAALAKQGGRFIVPSAEEIKTHPGEEPGAAAEHAAGEELPGTGPAARLGRLVELRACQPKLPDENGLSARARRAPRRSAARRAPRAGARDHDGEHASPRRRGASSSTRAC